VVGSGYGWWHGRWICELSVTNDAMSPKFRDSFYGKTLCPRKLGVILRQYARSNRAAIFYAD